MPENNNRHVSEYSPDNESSMNSQSRSKIKVSNDEKKQARVHLYREIFKKWKALLGIIPCLAEGSAPILIFLVLGSLMNNMTVFGNFGTLSTENMTEIEAATATAEYYSKMKTAIDDLMGKIEIKCIWLVAIAVLAGGGKFFDSVLWIRAGAELSFDLKSRLFHNMMKFEVSFFDINSIGAILTMLSEDAQLVQDAFGTTKAMQVTSLFQFILGLLLGFIYSWRITLIALCCIPAVFIIITLTMPFILGASQERFRHVANSMTIAEEVLSSIRTVRGFNMEDRETKRFLDETEKMGKTEAKVGRALVVMIHLILASIWAFCIGNLYYGSSFVGNKENGKEFTTGRLFSCFGYTMMGSFAIIALMGSLQGEEKAISAGARILKFINHVPEIPFDGGEILDDFRGDIEFRNVSFKYPTRDVYVLRNVSWKINAGQKGALVGHSGSGKSTCVQLLERYYEAQEGIILIDGHDIRTLDPRWLHHKIAQVSQEPTLFKGTIRENILYGAEPDTTEEQVIAAAEVANASRFISKLSKGFEEQVGEKGNQLSGGQRQRIAIARAIIKNPVILITDEATSALDSESEKKVQIALDKVMEGRTGVIVAHRLSTIKNADIIYVFEAGEIKEVGKHDELVRKGGWYFNLVKRQLNVDELNKIEKHIGKEKEGPAIETPKVVADDDESESYSNEPKKEEKADESSSSSEEKPQPKKIQKEDESSSSSEEKPQPKEIQKEDESSSSSESKPEPKKQELKNESESEFSSESD